MNRDNQKTLCTLLAVMAPLAHNAGAGYMAVLLAAGAMLPLAALAGDGLKRISKPEAALEWIWLGVVMGTLMGVSGANWPGSRSEIVVPLTIIALAVITGSEEKSVRACCTLFWIMIVPVILILAVMTSKTDPDWLKPEPGTWTGGLIAALLLPALEGTGRADDGKRALSVAVMAGFLAVIMQGGLGTEQASVADSPLYELGRCVGNGGFEIIVSVVLTLSWYGFAALGMRSAERFGAQIGLLGIQSRAGAGIIAALMVLAERQIEEWIIIGGSLILWVLIPILHPKKINRKK